MCIRDSHIPDHVSGGHNASLAQCALVGVILAQMGVIVGPFLVEAADADSPASVLVPAQGFHIAGFHRNNGSSRLPQHIVAQMLPAVAVGAGNAKVIVVGVGEIFGNGKEGFQAVFCHPHLFGRWTLGAFTD